MVRAVGKRVPGLNRSSALITYKLCAFRGLMSQASVFVFVFYLYNEINYISTSHYLNNEMMFIMHLPWLSLFIQENNYIHLITIEAYYILSPKLSALRVLISPSQPPPWPHHLCKIKI